jgi:hypothetical protein
VRKVEIGWLHAASVSSLLRKLGSDQGIPPDLRANADYWSHAMTRRMERRDLQTVAWLLLSVSGERNVAFDRRRNAQYWGAYLEGRI